MIESLGSIYNWTPTQEEKRIYHRPDITLFRTLVSEKGFEGGLISGPQLQVGTIEAISITTTFLVVIRWTPQPQGERPALPLFFSLGAIHKYSEAGEEDVFHAFAQNGNLWVICFPTSLPQEEANKPESE